MGQSDTPPQPPPAEELIVEIYRQRSLLVEAGRRPTRVIMSAGHYEQIRNYHRGLGAIAPGRVDYLDRYRVFDLEICVEEVEQPVVEAE